jgi:hypothetical protein
MSKEDEQEEVRDALECVRQAGLMAVHGTVCEWGEAVSCPAEYGARGCECGYDDHNKEVEESIKKLSLLLTSRGLI